MRFEPNTHFFQISILLGPSTLNQLPKIYQVTISQESPIKNSGCFPFVPPPPAKGLHNICTPDAHAIFSHNYLLCIVTFPISGDAERSGGGGGTKEIRARKENENKPKALNLVRVNQSYPFVAMSSVGYILFAPRPNKCVVLPRALQ